jgi:hypothetical protein
VQLRGLSVCNLSKNTPARAGWNKSESKSQLQTVRPCRCCLCMQSIKEHNLKANHNHWNLRTFWGLSVCNLSKNTIWKQITTRQRTCYWRNRLYAIYQRTQSESKSQRNNVSCINNNICMQSIKEHNLKANHNYTFQRCKYTHLYAIYQRTLPLGRDETNLKANHNIKREFVHLLSLYAIYQRTLPLGRDETNLKANHNCFLSDQLTQRSVCNLSKNTPARAGWNKSESKSQLDRLVNRWPVICMQSIKEHSR